MDQFGEQLLIGVWGIKQQGKYTHPNKSGNLSLDSSLNSRNTFSSSGSSSPDSNPATLNSNGNEFILDLDDLDDKSPCSSVGPKRTTNYARNLEGQFLGTNKKKAGAIKVFMQERLLLKDMKPPGVDSNPHNGKIEFMLMEALKKSKSKNPSLFSTSNSDANLNMASDKVGEESFNQKEEPADGKYSNFDKANDEFMEKLKNSKSQRVINHCPVYPCQSACLFSVCRLTSIKSEKCRTWKYDKNRL